MIFYPRRARRNAKKVIIKGFSSRFFAPFADRLLK